jgi:hypothetical protein
MVCIDETRKKTTPKDTRANQGLWLEFNPFVEVFADTKVLRLKRKF